MKHNQLKLGTLLSYLRMGLGTVISLLYTPTMIRLLGQSEYGLYNTVASTISMLSILSMGFNSGYIRYYAKYKKEDMDAVYRLNGLFLLIFTGIGAVALVCGLFLSNHLELVFSTGLTANEYAIAKKLMLVLTVNLALSFPMSVMANIVTANERYVFHKVLSILKTVTGPMVTLPLLLMGYGSVAIVAVTVALNILVDLCHLYYVLVILKNRFYFRGIDRHLAEGLLSFTAFIALNMLVDQVNDHVDQLLLGRYVGTAAVAVYSVGYALSHYFMLFSTSVSSVFTPRIHGIVHATQHDRDEQRRQLTDLFVRVGRVQCLILMLVATGLLFYGKYFITRIWAGPEYEESYYVMLLLVLPALIHLIQNLGIEIQRAQNKHRFCSVVYLLMAAINLSMTIVLCQRYGAIGATVGTAVSLLVANGLIMNIYYHKNCNVDILRFWSSIMRLLRGLILPLIYGCISNRMFASDSLFVYCVQIVLYTAVYCGSMWFFGMNDYEKQLIGRFIRRMR